MARGDDKAAEEYRRLMGEQALARQTAKAKIDKPPTCSCSQRTTRHKEVPGPWHRMGCPLYAPEESVA
jgi:hypothetical protein